MTAAAKLKRTYEGGVAKRASHTARTFTGDIRDCSVPAISTESPNSKHCHPDPCKACPLREVHDYPKFSNVDKTTHFCSSLLMFKGKSMEITDKHI